MALIGDHRGRTCCYYLDVPFDESLRRHAGTPRASQYGATEMRAWYRELDLLPGGTEQVIPAAMPQDEIVRRVMADSGLAASRRRGAYNRATPQSPRWFTRGQCRILPWPRSKFTTQYWNHPGAPFPRLADLALSHRQRGTGGLGGQGRPPAAVHRHLP